MNSTIEKMSFELNRKYVGDAMLVVVNSYDHSWREETIWKPDGPGAHAPRCRVVLIVDHQQNGVVY